MSTGGYICSGANIALWRLEGCVSAYRSKWMLIGLILNRTKDHRTPLEEYHQCQCSFLTLQFQLGQDKWLDGGIPYANPPNHHSIKWFRQLRLILKSASTPPSHTHIYTNRRTELKSAFICWLAELSAYNYVQFGISDTNVLILEWVGTI